MLDSIVSHLDHSSLPIPYCSISDHLGEFFLGFLFLVILYEFLAVVLQDLVLLLAIPTGCFLYVFSSTELHRVSFWCCFAHDADDMGTCGMKLVTEGHSSRV